MSDKPPSKEPYLSVEKMFEEARAAREIYMRQGMGRRIPVSEQRASRVVVSDRAYARSVVQALFDCDLEVQVTLTRSAVQVTGAGDTLIDFHSPCWQADLIRLLRDAPFGRLAAAPAVQLTQAQSLDLLRYLFSMPDYRTQALDSVWRMGGIDALATVLGDFISGKVTI